MKNHNAPLDDESLQQESGSIEKIVQSMQQTVIFTSILCVLALLVSALLTFEMLSILFKEDIPLRYVLKLIWRQLLFVLLLIGFTGVIGWRLFDFTKKINVFTRERTQENLDEVLRAQLRFWSMSGIITVLMLLTMLVKSWDSFFGKN